MPQDKIFVVEPHIEELPVELADERIELVDLDEALESATVVLLLTDHREFLEIDPHRLHAKRLVDTRGAWRESYFERGNETALGNIE